jgi:vacuolar-type H+-ATPase subunit I/STV1
MKVSIIDPPSGWMYGFPRIHDRPNHQSLEEWLVEKGYPARDAGWASEHCRYWQQEVIEEEEKEMDIDYDMPVGFEHNDLTGEQDSAILGVLDELQNQLDLLENSLVELKVRLTDVEEELDAQALAEMMEIIEEEVATGASRSMLDSDEFEMEVEEDD